MSTARVYPDSSGLPTRNSNAKTNGAPDVPANVPEDETFAVLYAERIVGYHPLLSRALKLSEDVPKRVKDRHLERATIFLSNLLYWTPRSSTGWVYKSMVEIEEETDLSRRAQDGARELLREAGVLEERRKREIYYRVGWGPLKPLLRLAIQDRHIEYGRGEPDQVRHVEQGGNDRHVEQRTKYDMSSTEKVRHVERASVSTTRDEHTALEHPSIDARESSGEGVDVSPASGRDGLIDEHKGSESQEEEASQGRTPSERTTSREVATPRASGSEGGTNGKPHDRTLKDKLCRKISEVVEVSEEAASIGARLHEVLGDTPSSASGDLAQIAEYCLGKGYIELLAEVAARNEGRKVTYPLRYFASALASAYKDEEASPRTSRPGSPAARFEAAYVEASSGSKPSAAPSRRDPEGRHSLTGRTMNPVYGVRSPEAQRKSTMSFKKAGSQKRHKPQRPSPGEPPEAPPRTASGFIDGAAAARKRQRRAAEAAAAEDGNRPLEADSG